MFILFPLPATTSTTVRRVPVVTITIAVLVVLVRLAEWALPMLPPLLQEALAHLAWLRLNSAPDSFAWLFRPWQLWTHCLLVESIGALLLQLVVWLPLAGGAERRLGSAIFGGCLAVILPLAAGVFVVAGEGVIDLGLYLPIMIAGGLLLALEVRSRVPWVLGWWFIDQAGWVRWSLGSGVLLLGFIALEAVQLLGGDTLLGPEDRWRFVPVYAIAGALAFALAQIEMRLLAAWQAATDEERT